MYFFFEKDYQTRVKQMYFENFVIESIENELDNNRIKKYDEAGITLPVLLEHYKSACPTNESAFNVIINQYSTEHGLNEYFEKIIKDALK